MKKKILRGKILRPALNRVYKDSDDRKTEKAEKVEKCTNVKECTDSDIIRRYIDRNRRKEDTNKYYYS